MKKWIVPTILAFLLFASVSHADIVIMSRTSFAIAGAFAGSNGATRTESEDSTLEDLTGSFAFNQVSKAEVFEDDTFSDGHARSTSSINVTDDVNLSAGMLNITAARSSTIRSEVFTGPASATSRATHNLTVRFEVVDEDAVFQLTGDFSPGPNGNNFNNTGRIRLTRPGTGLHQFNVTDAGSLNETGTLLAGRVYELQIRMGDGLMTTTNLPSLTDSSTLNMQFSVTSLSAVPEPAALPIALLSGCTLLIRRRSTLV